MTHADTQRHVLRDRLTEKRRQLGPTERIQAALGVRRSLEQLPEFMTDERIAGYWACAGELPLNLVMASLAERGQDFYLPVIAPPRQMRFAAWRIGDDIAPNRHGIPEPAQQDKLIPPPLLDVVLVPLVGFDRRGNRLGFGGGYYDASFAFLRDEKRPATPLLVGIGYAFQELDALDAEPWDIRLDYIATESELIDCTEPESP
ncbi:MAG TPA: 5-formyltetrahydrofolate cyclo-ligase [Oleiagrimonas sp.]|nr:5-formyltetrahydrofolate cyclo-ligase [Oleiagrimonas sp.]